MSLAFIILFVIVCILLWNVSPFLLIAPLLIGFAWGIIYMNTNDKKK